MLNVMIKSIIVFFVVLFVIRLMGKRQLGEMQPFELVVTLIIAEVACIPMNDPYIPFYYGIVPIITLAFLHILFSFLSRKSMIVRKVLSGRSVIVIDKDGINYENLKRMNLNINDLIEAVRTSGYIDLSTVAYAIFETNGKLCVVEKPSDPTQPQPALLPIEVVVDGNFHDRNLQTAGLEKTALENVFTENGLTLKDVLYADVRQDGNLFVSPKYASAFTANVELSNEEGW